MKILITTGIYPPKIGGPAQYAKNLKESFEKMEHEVMVKTFEAEDRLPSGIRHIYFFFKILPALVRADTVFILDTFSVGLPTVLAGKILGKKTIIRTGGDFLWEQYVERTGKMVLLREFYDTEKNSFSFRDRMVFFITRWVLKNVSKTIFSTKWQRDIFIKAYGMKMEKTALVENYFAPKQSDKDYRSKIFVASARNLIWKNLDALKGIFEDIEPEYPEAQLFTQNLPYDSFMDKMSEAYAVMLVSLGDISPNMIMDAIKLNRPFICTREIGIYDRIKDAGIFVDPLDRGEIKGAILGMLSPEGYQKAKEKVRNFNFTHSWDEIAREFLQIAAEIK